MIAILLIYFLSLQMPKSSMVPVINTCFLIGKLSQITILSAAGMVSLMLAAQTVPLAAAALAALFAGQKLGKAIDNERYTRIVYGLLFLLAIILLIQFFHDWPPR